MARINVKYHGEEDVSTASQKVKNSLHDLKEKAKETMSPFTDLTNTIKTVAGLGGAAMVLKQIYGELSQMEKAFAAANPELQKTAGSLLQWTSATDNLKVALGGLVSSALTPLRATLISMIDPWVQNINLMTQVANLIDRLKDSGGTAQIALAARLEALQAEKRAAEKGSRATTFAQGFMSYALGPAAGLDKNAQAEMQATKDLLKALDAEIESVTQQLKEGSKEAIKMLTAPAAAVAAVAETGLSPKGEADQVLQTLSDIAKYDMGMAAALRSMAEPGGNGAFWALGGPAAEQPIPQGYEDPVVYAQAMAEAFAQALPEIDIPAPGGGADPAAGLGFASGLMDTIMQLAGQFQSLSLVLDPVNTILNAAYTVLAPMVDSLLGPLVGILTIIGQTLAAVLMPMLKFLAPVIDFIGKAFVWLYNNAIVPFENALIHIYTALAALATLIFYIVTFQWGKIKGITWTANDEDLLKPITTGDLTSTTNTDGYGGGSTNVVKPPDIYVYITVEGSVYGAGGPVEVGREMVRAIEDYIGTGARVSFLEAGA
jgi:hypothetical protein